MSFATMDDIIAALHAQERVPTFKLSIGVVAAAVWTSTWKNAGVPGAGVTPATGSGATPTNATAGALRFTDPAGGAHKRLLVANMIGTQRGLVALVDRLVHTSGLSGTVTTAQTVNTVALPSRDANGSNLGDGVEAWLEVYSALGVTSRTVSVSYTNQAGTAGQVGTATIPSSAPVGRSIPIALAAGDTGVRSVENLTLSGSTGTAGDFGVTLVRRVAHLEMPAIGLPSSKGPFDTGMPRLYAGSCLSFIVISDSSTTMSVWGDLVMGEK